MDQRPALSRRREPKQKRSQELIAATLTATARVLIDEGLDAVTTQRIAEVAGVSVGSLYQYFPNSLAVLRALLERHLGEIGGEIEVVIRRAKSRDGLIRGAVATFLNAKRRRGALSLALRRVESLIDGRLVEQETARPLAAGFSARLAAISQAPAPWRTELFITAVAGAVDHALETAPARLADPAFAEALVRMAKAALTET